MMLLHRLTFPTQTTNQLPISIADFAKPGETFEQAFERKRNLAELKKKLK